ncbi:MAG: ATP-dependent DNA helicase RecG [Syntrophaceae bacterium]|nr:ATP-dependent DNA helicase RecG [Syntrophaceae bacterium]
MSQSEIDEILEAMEKPLRYASGHDFANLKTLKGLESYLAHWLDRAAALSVSPRSQSLLQSLRLRAQGFDLLDLAEKKARILEVQKIIHDLKGEDEAPLPCQPWPTQEEFRQSRKDLQTSIQFIKGVGPRLSEVLKKKNIVTVEDALYFLPRLYQDRRQIKTISQLAVGKIETVMGTVLQADMTPYRRRRTFELTIGDETGTLIAKWFNFNPRFMKGRFKKGMRLILFGEVRLYQFQKEIHHPELEIIEEEEPQTPDGNEGSPPGKEESLHFGRIVPVYSETEGLYQRQRLIRRIMKNTVDLFAAKEFSGIPEEICRRQNLIPLSEAFRRAHYPDAGDDLALLNEGKSPAHRRLVFDELFFLELGLALRRSGTLMEKGISFLVSHRHTCRLREILPFSLTPAQERVLAEIEADMRRPHPMNRLLQGDVGSGKTIVALLSGLMAVEGGFQVALMAPTEILAEQHYFNIRPLVEKLGLLAALLTSSLKKSEKETFYARIRTGEIHVVIGTHAIIQETVEFHRLGLAIIDEQHKFGVLQRATLKKKGTNPDVLVMTATPIPRTLAMTLYGDLEVSVIDQLPPGRGSITTRVFNEKERFRVYRLMREEIAKGKQAYVVYPLVEESERLDLKDATQMAKNLQRDIFPEFKVGLIHGRMKSEEKEAIMADFKARRIHILVSTIVIEVGIDVPNASVMVIEHAERFGLSQLHQLRGRVGRGKDPSQCLLIAQYPRSEEAERRLRVMEQTTDGFKIAEEDLAIRGPGELMGTQQSGLPDFRVANFARDIQLLNEARKEAFGIISCDPILSMPEHFFMKETLKERWKGRLELATIG